MKKFSRHSSRLVLAAGAAASLAVLPQNVSAQIVGSYMRPGAVSAQPGAVVTTQNQGVPVQQTMRPGPVVRGSLPIYRQAPVVSSGSVYGNAPVYSRGPVSVTVQSPVYGRGGNSYSGNNYSGSGPVVTVPADPYYPSGYAFGNGQYGNGAYGGAYLPPVGPGNGYFRNPIPPVGPANGFFSGQAPITGGGPALLGGYYYGNYCNTGAFTQSYPSVYSTYSGFPPFIYSPNVTLVDNSYTPDYTTPSLPFYTPVYQTIYHQDNYYVATEGRVADLEAGGERAKAALNHAYAASSFQAAFADIARAWTDGNLDLVRKHLRNPETRISVFLDGKYSYSIASSDFAQITRDALDRLQTVSFDFTHLRKAKNGDVTAFGAHVYRTADAVSTGDTGIVPFDQPGSDTTGAGADQTTMPLQRAAKTVYVSYTLRRYGDEWDIVATNSADHDLAASSTKTTE